MVSQRLRQIKREIRVLGVAAKGSSKNYTIVGVVYRGNLWLDGVLTTYSNKADITDTLAQMLVNSPHYGQVRVILLSRENLPTEVSVSAEELSTKTGKPVVLLGDTVEPTSTWNNGDEKATFLAVGLSIWSAEGILRMSTREGVTPEALRLAALALSALPDEGDT